MVDFLESMEIPFINQTSLTLKHYNPSSLANMTVEETYKYPPQNLMQ